MTRFTCSYMIWDLPHPLPSSPESKLSLFLSIPGRGSNLLTEYGEGRGRGGAKSHDREKAWPYINHSILFDPMHPRTPLSSPHPVTAPPKVCGGAGHPAFWKGGGGERGEGEGLTNAEDWPFKHETERGHRGWMRSNKRLLAHKGNS